jgi:hypothetical protein
VGKHSARFGKPLHNGTLNLSFDLGVLLMSVGTMQDLCRHSTVKAMIYKDILAQAKESKLNGWCDF